MPMIMTIDDMSKTKDSYFFGHHKIKIVLNQLIFYRALGTYIIIFYKIP